MSTRPICYPKGSLRKEGKGLGWGSRQKVYMMIRVALIDDHPLILRILRQELARCTDLEIVWVATDAEKVMSLVAGATPDVLVLDLAYAGRGFEPVSAVRDLVGRFGDMSIIILTANDDPTWIERLLKACARDSDI